MESQNTRYKCAMLEFKNGISIIDYDEDLNNIYDMLKHCKKESNFKNPFETTTKSIKETNDFYNNFFRLHEILHIDTKDANYIDTLNKPEYVKSDMLLHFSKLISPFDIPIKFDDKLKDAIKCTIISDKNDFQTIYHEIYLRNIKNRLVRSSYAHEIMHSQTEKIVTDYHNDEVLSIFIEFLVLENCPFNKKLLMDALRIRLRDLKYEIKLVRKYYQNYISKEKAIEASKYIKSTLIALRLLTKYIYANDTRKKEIINCIQNVIDRNKTLEEMLSKLDIDYYSSKKILIRKLERSIYGKN